MIHYIIKVSLRHYGYAKWIPNLIVMCIAFDNGFTLLLKILVTKDGSR